MVYRLWFIVYGLSFMVEGLGFIAEDGRMVAKLMKNEVKNEFQKWKFVGCARR